MARDEKEDDRSGGEELAGGCKLLPVVDLLPLRQIVILALVERKRRPLHPMPCHKRDECVCDVEKSPGCSRVHEPLEEVEEEAEAPDEDNVERPEPRGRDPCRVGVFPVGAASSILAAKQRRVPC